MRTINATLKSAIATGSIDFIARLRVYVSGVYYATLQVLDYKLTGTELEVTAYGLIPASNAPDDIKIILERGVTIAGYEYTLLSSKFTPKTGAASVADNVGIISTTVQAHIVPDKRITFAGDVSYQTAITSFCTAIGKTCSFKRPGDAYWAYQFLPTGRIYTANNAQAFLTFLHQKYFIYCCDNGSEELMFYHALAAPAKDAYLLPALYKASVGYYQKRRYLARDENNTVRYGGGATDPIHNLGFVKSTENLPTNYSQLQPVSFELPISLEYQDGDCFDVDDGNYYMFPAEVTEIFDTKHSPSWYLTIAQRLYFSSTEGGALPSTIEAAAPYTPLNTSKFNGTLSAADNNLQAAMETIDDLNARKVITANRTYYVRTDGNDSNTGLVDSAAGAFLTIQAAINAASAVDSSIYNIIIQVRDGTYVSGFINCSNLFGSGNMTIQGNNGTPANVVIDGGFVKSVPGTLYMIKDMKLIKSSGSATVAIEAYWSGTIYIYNLEFSSGFYAHLLCYGGGIISAKSNYKILSGATYHMSAEAGSLIEVQNLTITLTGTPAFTLFVYADACSMFYLYGDTFSGGATGSRFSVTMNSTVQTYGSGLNYLPGNSAGTTATGGQYA